MISVWEEIYCVKASAQERPVASQEKTGSNSPEEDVVPGNQDEADLARVFTKGTKALSGCLPYCLVGILFIVILYVLLLIFRRN